MKLEALSDEWVSVYQGAPPMAALLVGELEDNGIHAWTPDANMKALDPLDVGGMVFDSRVLVPRESAERARAIVAAVQHEPAAVEPAKSPDALARDAQAEELERLGRRIRWSAAVVAFAPYGLWLAARYFTLSREAHVRVPAHRATVLATVIAVVEVLAGVFFLRMVLV